MSESSEDKTKRKFKNALKNNTWKYRLNLYFNSYEFGIDLYLYLSKMNSSLRQKNNNVGFVYRVCLNNTRKYVFDEFKDDGYDDSKQFVLAPMVTYFCTAKPILPNLKRIRSFKMCDYKYTPTEQTEDDITAYLRVLDNQRPHNIKDHLNGNLQRYGFVNKRLFN